MRLLVVRRVVVSLAWVIMLASLVAWGGVPCASRHARYSPDDVQILRSIKQANIVGPLAPNALTSYRYLICVSPNIGKPLTGSSPGLRPTCLKGEVGVLAPTSGYLKVTAGAMHIFHVVNESQAWQLAFSPAQQRTETGPGISKLEEVKLRAMKESISHSLPSLFQVLNTESWDLTKMKITQRSYEFLISWTDSGAVNEYYFDRQSLLCEKQVRRTADGVTVLKYSDYKKVDAVMLPHKIEQSGADGKIIGTQAVEQWLLAVSWPDDFFTPRGVVKPF